MTAWLWAAGFSAVCWRTLAVLCTQQRCSRVVGHSSASAFQEPERTVGDDELRRDDQTSVLQIEQQFAPILGALARAVGEAEQFLLAR